MKRLIPAALALILVPAMAFGLGVVVDDSWADGDRANTGPLQADWWSSSDGTPPPNSLEVSVGEMGLVTGTSGRGLHGTFAPQTLAIGETIVATYSFTTPATVGNNKSTAFKVAMMEFNNAGLAADLSSSSSSVNPLYVGLPGYMADYDVNKTDASDDVSIRIHDVASPLGRFLGTTSEWTDSGSSPDVGYDITANTSYVGVFSIARTGATDVDVFSSLSLAAGGLLDQHTRSYAGTVPANFGMLGFWGNSNTFGSTNALGDPDNGITFSNVKIEVIPEPSTLALVLGGLVVGLLRQRRS